MLDDLLENRLIELPEPKRPQEAGRTSDPKYCRYHRVVSHHLEKCVTLKERIMQLARDGKIILDLDDYAGANHISAEYSPPSRQQRLARSCQQRESSAIGSQGLFTIQFGSLEPVILPLMVRGPVMETNSNPAEDEEGWMLVTRRRPRNPKQAQPPPLCQKKRQGRRKTPRCAKSKKKSNASKK